MHHANLVHRRSPFRPHQRHPILRPTIRRRRRDEQRADRRMERGRCRRRRRLGSRRLRTRQARRHAAIGPGAAREKDPPRGQSRPLLVRPWPSERRMDTEVPRRRLRRDPPRRVDDASRRRRSPHVPLPVLRRQPRPRPLRRASPRGSGRVATARSRPRAVDATRSHDQRRRRRHRLPPDQRERNRPPHRRRDPRGQNFVAARATA